MKEKKSLHVKQREGDISGCIGLGRRGRKSSPIRTERGQRDGPVQITRRIALDAKRGELGNIVPANVVTIGNDGRINGT